VVTPGVEDGLLIELCDSVPEFALESFERLQTRGEGVPCGRPHGNDLVTDRLLQTHNVLKPVRVLDRIHSQAVEPEMK
jgi:hypothetical protein